MCGESNPPDLEVCQHCQARLKPLLPDDDGGFSMDLPEDELPDWLSDLREDEMPDIQPQAGEEKLDWMASTDSASDPTLSQSSESPEDDPEWLSNLRVGEPEIQSPKKEYNTSPARPRQDQEDPTWLQELRQRQEQEAGDGEAAVPPEDSGDYMERIQNLQTDDNEAASETSDQSAENRISDFSTGDLAAESANLEEQLRLILLLDLQY